MGQYRSTPDKTKKSYVGSDKRLEFCCSGMCGWRKYMEDAHISKLKFGPPNLSLFAVFDGHGGPEVAKYVENHFIDELIINENFTKKKYEQALTYTYMKMDKMLKTSEGEKEVNKIKKTLMAADKQDSEGMSEYKSCAGCTAVVCLITENYIYVANAGDSRCILGTNGKVDYATTDHKPDDPAELARIKKAGGEVMEGRINGNLNLSRAIGDLYFKYNKNLKPYEQLIISKPDVFKRPLAGIDTIVMGCDGIFYVKSNQEILDIMLKKTKKEEKKLKQAAEEILDELLAPSTDKYFGLDNMSLILIKVKL